MGIWILWQRHISSWLENIMTNSEGGLIFCKITWTNKMIWTTIIFNFWFWWKMFITIRSDLIFIVYFICRIRIWKKIGIIRVDVMVHVFFSFIDSVGQFNMSHSYNINHIQYIPRKGDKIFIEYCPVCDQNKRDFDKKKHEFCDQWLLIGRSHSLKIKIDF